MIFQPFLVLTNDFIKIEHARADIFTGANLANADLRGANIRDADFTDARTATTKFR